MKSIKLTLIYKLGTKVEQVVHYVHFEENVISFTVKNQVNYSVVSKIIKVPLENLASFIIEETEEQWND